MPLDPSISLQTKGIEPGNAISGFLDLGLKATALQRQKATLQADIERAKAESSTAQSGATVAAANVQPLIQQQAAVTSQAQTGAQSSAYRLQGEQANKARELAGGLVQDPDFVSGNLDGMLAKLNDLRATMIQSGIPTHTAVFQTAALESQALKDPKSVVQILKNVIVQNQNSAQQASTVNPNLAMVPTQAGTQPFNTNSFAPGGVGPQGPAMTPPNQIATDTTGGAAIVNPARGTAASIQSSGPQMAFPPGETRDTQAELQNQRTAAQQAASAAPVMHDINRSIVQEVDKGITTGTLGTLIQKVKSATGFPGEVGTDYNILGKMLERSALTAAQGMGPHTNAGLEAQVRANGSTDYTPAAIRKIATLNDALVTGSTLYQSGLEKALSGQNGVFEKRKFDQQWNAAFNPSGGINGVQAMRLKNAVDNGDQKGIAEIVKEVGGAGSKGASQLHQKLLQIQALSE